MPTKVLKITTRKAPCGEEFYFASLVTGDNSGAIPNDVVIEVKSLNFRVTSEYLLLLGFRLHQKSGLILSLSCQANKCYLGSFVSFFNRFHF
ncbi:hypothetical protein AALP_AA3G090600 [Arabis alpina]|uniref:Uncharacterized protein n=1 Tax=Arabis alpina TaxID=50452 RepID=A0A087H809_ARAAL|nr:hypothetical protein AALP_AA3G090600 [Arabis alpina]